MFTTVLVKQNLTAVGEGVCLEGGWASVLPKKQGSLPTRPRQTHGFHDLQHPRDETRENRTL